MTTELKFGDRVTRPAGLDDGTWRDEGDSCLEDSPLRRGQITRIRPELPDRPRLIYVTWDDGGGGYYFDHGISREEAS